MNDTTTNIPRAAFVKLLLNESRLAWRVPIGLGSGLGLPLLMLVIFGSIPKLRQAQDLLGGFSYFALSFPILIATTALVLGVTVMPRSLINYRATGILRRLSV